MTAAGRGWGNALGLDLSEVPDEKLAGFWKKIDRQKDHWVWLPRSAGKYAAWQVPGIGRVVSAHKVAWVLRHGPLEAGQVLVKTCDVDRCVHCWDTFRAPDGALRIRRTGNIPPEVRLLREARAAGASLEDLAKLTTLNSNRIRLIVLNQVYREAGDDPHLGSRRAEHPHLYRLTAKDVQEMREENSSGVPINRIAKGRGVSYATAWEAVRGRSSHLRRLDLSARTDDN